MTDNHLPADASWLFPEYDFRRSQRGQVGVAARVSVAVQALVCPMATGARGNGLRCTRVGSGGQEDGAMVDFYELTTTPACRHAQAIDAGKVGGCTCLLRSGRPPADAPLERVGRLNGK